jgi:hypothetical protein
MDVHMKMIADQVVRRVSTLAAARGPNAVCEPWPPKAPAKIGRAALLQQDDADQEEAHDHVQDDTK